MQEDMIWLDMESKSSPTVGSVSGLWFLAQNSNYYDHDFKNFHFRLSF